MLWLQRVAGLLKWSVKCVKWRRFILLQCLVCSNKTTKFNFSICPWKSSMGTWNEKRYIIEM
jgi:hypothetical protein